MVTMMSTKLTKGGQTTIPKEIRTSLGIENEARVYWAFDGTRAWLSAEPLTPLTVTSKEDFHERLAAAESSAARGNVRDAKLVSKNLRVRYGLD